MAAGTATFFVVGDDLIYLFFLPGLVAIGVGIAYASVAQSQLYLAEAPADEFGPVTSSRMTVGQFGFALGLAGSSTLMAQMMTDGVVDQLRKAGVPPQSWGEGIAAARLHIRSASTGEQGEGVLDAAAPNYVDVFSLTMLVSAVLVALLGLLSWYLLRRSARAAVPTD